MKLQGKIYLGLVGIVVGLLIACSGAPIHTTKTPAIQRTVGTFSMDMASIPVKADTLPWERHAILTVYWPKRSIQVIPSDTESILFQAFALDGGALIASASVSRPAHAATSSVTLPEAKGAYLPLDKGTLVFVAQAKNSSNKVVAEAQQMADVRENQVITVILTLVATSTPTPTPAPTRSPAPTPTLAPTPTPTPTPTPVPLFTQVDGVPGLEVMSDTTIRLYPGDSGNQVGEWYYPVRRLGGIARSAEGDIRFLVYGIDAPSISQILGCQPYGARDCGNICDYMGRSDEKVKSHEAIFKLASAGDSLEFVEMGKEGTSTDNSNDSCTYYGGWSTDSFFSEWSTHSSNTLLEGVDKSNGTMAIKAGTIPSGETSLPIPEYFSDVRFKSSRMADTSTALWYVSWRTANSSPFDDTEDLSYPMENLAIARWQFSTKSWVKAPPENKVLRYLSNGNGDININCDSEYGRCSRAYKIYYVIHSASEGKFYLFLYDWVARTSYHQIYRVSESALTGL